MGSAVQAAYDWPNNSVPGHQLTAWPRYQALDLVVMEPWDDLMGQIKLRANGLCCDAYVPLSAPPL